MFEVLTSELLDEANKGRGVLDPNGSFVIPRGIGRVWVDVGAHDLETTRHALLRLDDVLLIAIEPLAEHWRKWPEHPNLIALPVAISGERGWLDFNVAASDASSSLLKSASDSGYEEHLRTVEVRKVPVVRLDDVLERVPARLEIEYVKTDVQGLDLEVLRSAGEQLRRVTFVRAEVIRHRLYEEEDNRRPATEAEFLTYMSGMGFNFLSDWDVEPGRRWLDKQFVNERDGRWDRARRWVRSLFSVGSTDPI